MTKTEKPVVEPVKGPDELPNEPEGRLVLDLGYDSNFVLRNEPDEVAVTYALLSKPDAQLSLGRHGYLQFGGGLFYRPIGFDLGAGAVICARVPN